MTAPQVKNVDRFVPREVCRDRPYWNTTRSVVGQV